jgi:transcription elongation factor GreB
MTVAGATQLREELRLLRTVERPPLAARAASDHDARIRLAAIDQRIRYLQQSLVTAEIVKERPGPSDVVRFGCTVVVREPDGTMVQYRLVGVDETDPARGAISWVSPLAQALMNGRVGTTVELSTPAGPKRLAIVAARFDAEPD